VSDVSRKRCAITAFRACALVAQCNPIDTGGVARYSMVGGGADCPRWNDLTAPATCGVVDEATDDGSDRKPAVVIGLADFVAQHWAHPWASGGFVTTVLGAIAIYEIIGPVMIKWIAVRSGEVKAVTLLRREGSGIGIAAVVRLTGGALLRMLGIRLRARAAADALCVRDVMRSNVKCIPADARFDEVLHMIEDSHYNHFPVIDSQEQLVGVLHYADIREIIFDRALYDLVTAAETTRWQWRLVA
jgi:CBS domain-containing protein